MAYYNFTFNNTNEDQDFLYDDLIDLDSNPHEVGVVNHDTTSETFQCWVGSDGNGKIQLKGKMSGPLNVDVKEDNYNFDYT